MVLSCNSIGKEFNGDPIIENITFNIDDKEKAAVIGVNGAGKTTLLKIITGEIPPTSGEVVIPKDIHFEYFSQNIELSSDKTVYDELLTIFEPIIELENEIRLAEKNMSSLSGESLEKEMNRYDELNARFEKLNGYGYKSRLRGVIKGLGFSDEESMQPVNQLSGGQKTRAALGKALLSQPQLLLLDEPTNHLDISSVRWLEDFLRAYSGSVVIVSHDRYFLDRIVTKVIEIENKKSKVYNGNYTFYSIQKEKDRQVELKHYMSQQKEIKHQEAVIKKLRQFNREKSIKRAESRQRALDKMDKLQRPESLPDSMRIAFTPKIESGNDVLDVESLKKSFSGNTLFENISFSIKKGEAAAVIGANGIGKTTMFKIIMKQISADSGSVKTGTNVTIGYYDQEHHGLNAEKTIFQEISDTYPKMSNLEIRNALASFVFTGDDVFKPISALSGGEKGRVSLAKIMLSNANFLILDEPTNHLDIISKEILESAIRNYEGTCLYISHDRYFINNTAEKIIELTPTKANIYLGDYDFYMEHLSADEQNAADDVQTQGKSDWKKQKQEQALQRKKENAVKKLEDEIEKIECEISEKDELLTHEDIYSDSQKTREIYFEKQELEDKLNELYRQWEEVSQ